MKDEANEKIARLEAQRATATAEAKAPLERRLAGVRSEYQAGCTLGLASQGASQWDQLLVLR